jgi:hypothetical protein
MVYRPSLEHTVVHVDPEHPKHAQWVTCLVSTQVMKELQYFQNCVQILATWAVHYHAET